MFFLLLCAYETWWHVFPQLVFSESFPDRMFWNMRPAAVFMGRMYRRSSITTDERRGKKIIFGEYESGWSSRAPISLDGS